MRSFVTGTSGFIGGALRDALVRVGHEVIALDTTELMHEAILTELARACDDDNVFLLGAHADVAYSAEHPDWDVRENVAPLIEQIQAANRARLICFASSFGGLFAGHVTARLDEQDLPNPVAPYFVGKLAGEGYLRVIRGDRRWVALRLPNVYGPRSDHGVIADWCDRRARGGKLDVWGGRESTRDYVYIDDIVDAFVRTLNAGDGIIHLGTGSTISLDTLGEAIWALNPEGSSLVGWEFEDAKPGYIKLGCRVDATKAREQLGWRPTVALEEGLRRTYSWWESHLQG